MSLPSLRGVDEGSRGVERRSRVAALLVLARCVRRAFVPISSLLLVVGVDRFVRALNDGYADFVMLPRAQSLVIGTLVCTALFMFAHSWAHSREENRDTCRRCYVLAAVFGLLAFGAWQAFSVAVETRVVHWQAANWSELGGGVDENGDEKPGSKPQGWEADWTVQRASPGAVYGEISGDWDGMKEKVLLWPLWTPASAEAEIDDYLVGRGKDPSRESNRTAAIESLAQDRLAPLFESPQHAWRVQATRAVFSLLSLFIAALGCIALAMLTPRFGEIWMESVLGFVDEFEAQAERERASSGLEGKPGVVTAPGDVPATVVGVPDASGATGGGVTATADAPPLGGEGPVDGRHATKTA